MLWPLPGLNMKESRCWQAACVSLDQRSPGEEGEANQPREPQYRSWRGYAKLPPWHAAGMRTKQALIKKLVGLAGNWELYFVLNTSFCFGASYAEPKRSVNWPHRSGEPNQTGHQSTKALTRGVSRTQFRSTRVRRQTCTFINIYLL